MSGLTVVGTLHGQASGYDASLAAIRSGHCREVAGSVESFVAMPNGGHADERFVVAEVPFAYNSFRWRPGLHQTMAEGGPIAPGRHVRICYRPDPAYGNVILRVVRETSELSAPE